MRVRRRLVTAIVAMIPIWLHSVRGGEMPSGAGETLYYDIAAQDLDTAIKSYVRISGMQVFFETAVMTGKRSLPLNGRFTATQALQNLLSGTGLTASRTDVDAFVIALGAPMNPSSSGALALPDPRFLGALQRGILDALCRDPLLQPGSYNVAVELWIAPNAVVQQASLIGSTRDLTRDRMLLERLRGLSIGQAPPANLPQPIAIRIRPRPANDTGDCDR